MFAVGDVAKLEKWVEIVGKSAHVLGINTEGFWYREKALKQKTYQTSSFPAVKEMKNGTYLKIKNNINITLKNATLIFLSFYFIFSSFCRAVQLE